MKVLLRLFPLDRWPVRLMQVGIDVFIVLAAMAAAYAVRFEAQIPHVFIEQLVVLAPIVALVRITANLLLGVYRIVWRYVGVREALLMFRAVLAVSLVLLGLRLVLPAEKLVLKVPISIITLEAVFTFLGMAGSRLLRRILIEATKSREDQDHELVPTILVGAGQNGLAIAKESLRHKKLGIRAVGFVDDDLTKSGMEVHGLRILGTLGDIESAVRRTGAKQAIITSSAIPSKSIFPVIDACRPLGVQVRTVPGLYEILDSSLSAQSLRDVRIEDLLSREPVPPSMSMDDLRAIYQGKRILVTGAGGSIGSEMCRQILALQPEQLIILERDENNLFEVHRDLSRNPSQTRCIPELVDIRARKELEQVFREHRPQAIFHAAAFKHVPMMERFPTSSAHNNVLGTQQLAELAHEHGAESFVMISTDKAVNPTSVMGATKRLAEIVIQRLAAKSGTRFSCVRFGNVLGSRGSVIPIFREQIKSGGPVTVTDPDATRYFMTIPEAANLVLQAGTLGDCGEVFLLDMGQPVKILDLARQMIHLSGKTEHEVPIQIIGKRPGEKLFEELKTDAEGIDATPLRKIFRVKPETFEERRVDEILQRLEFAIRAGDHTGVRVALEDLGIGYASPKPRQATGSHPAV